MRNLLNFLARYNNLIIFLVLQGIAVYLLSTGNNYHNSRFVKGFRSLTAGIEKRVSTINSYFQLRDISQLLARENAALRTSIERLSASSDQLFFSVTDTVHFQQYTFTSAQVVNNTLNRQKNFFTLNKGSIQGMKVDMAVISGDCVAGVIVGCSKNYSVAMPLINPDFRLSARLRKNGYFGSLSWDGSDVRHVTLNEIPQHVTFGVGDTVETTGYSAIFPEGIMIGTISDFEKSGGDFYKIRIALGADFRKLSYVTVIGNLRKEEQLELENQFQ